MSPSAFWVNLLVMAGVTYLIRMLPLTAVRGQIRSRFVQDFLHYIPYAVLGAMTFPAVFTCTGDVTASLAGLAVGVVLGLLNRGLLTVALGACVAAWLAGVLW